MDNQRSVPVWPFVLLFGLLSVLLVASMTAPRSWWSILVPPTRPDVTTSDDPWPRLATADDGLIGPSDVTAAATFEQASGDSTPQIEVALEEAGLDLTATIDTAPVSEDWAPQSDAASEEVSYDLAPQLDAAPEPPAEATVVVESLSETFPTLEFGSSLPSVELGPPQPPAVTAPAEPSVAAAPLPPTVEATPDGPSLKIDPPPSPLALALPVKEAEPVHRLPPTDQTLEVARRDPVWPHPTALADQLTELSEQFGYSSLVAPTLLLIDELGDQPSLRTGHCAAALRSLRSHEIDFRPAAQRSDSTQVRSELRRAAYAIARRLAIWEQVHSIAVSRHEKLDATNGDPSLMAAVREVERLIGNEGSAAAWREFLQIASLRELALDRPAGEWQRRREVSRTVLRRMESTQLDADQREFLSGPAFDTLQAELRRWAVRPVDYAALLRDIERYEAEGAASVAQQLASDCENLHWLTDPADNELAERLRMHYRNANLRVAVSAELLNRLLPSQSPIHEPVSDELLGARVSGRSRIASQLKIELAPDPHRWRVALVAQGDVSSQTASSKGPVTFLNNGHSRFLASKMLLVDRNGVRTQQAEAKATTAADLTGLQTEYDGVPMLAALVRSVAMQQHGNQHNLARSIMNGRIEDRVGDRFDKEVRDRLSEVEGQLDARIVKPLRQLGLRPTALETKTTTERLIARCRLAGDHQLAAYTPRPQAPSDSFVSVQMHESLFNNAIQRLKLEGKRGDLRDLYREVAAALSQPSPEIPEGFPENVTVQFAREEPLLVHCDSGRVTLAIKLAELSRGEDACWRNFLVRVHYRPDTDGLDASLVRDGVIELGGQRLRLGDQIALRGVFSKVFSLNRPVLLIDLHLHDKPQFQDLQFTQFIVDEGWIGMAAGPRRTRPGRWAKSRTDVTVE